MTDGNTCVCVFFFSFFFLCGELEDVVGLIGGGGVFRLGWRAEEDSSGEKKRKQEVKKLTKLRMGDADSYSPTYTTKISFHS